MPKRLTTEEKVKAITLIEEGYSYRLVALRLGNNVQPSTIQRLKKKYDETSDVKNRPVSGRPRLLTNRDERTVVRRIITNEYSTAIDVQKSLKTNEKLEVSTNTIRRVLKRNGFKARIKTKKPLLSKIHRKKRLEFANEYRMWSIEDWNKVVWSDESKFQIFGSDGRQYCWKKNGEQLSDRLVKPTVKFGRGSVFVWGCFTSLGIGYLCRIDGGLDGELYRQILSDEFQQTLEYYNLDAQNIIFQQDNDPKHTAKLTWKWFADNNI
jgi:transposase